MRALSAPISLVLISSNGQPRASEVIIFMQHSISLVELVNIFSLRTAKPAHWIVEHTGGPTLGPIPCGIAALTGWTGPNRSMSIPPTGILFSTAYRARLG